MSLRDRNWKGRVHVMRASMKLFVVLLCLCSNWSVVYGGTSGGTSNETYRAPICEASNGFYCPLTSSCISRDLRCTGGDSAPRCEQKTYNCSYDFGSGKFEVYRHSTPLQLAPLSRAAGLRPKGILDCLGREVAHQFITYRGLMYEFGSYGSRVQDPLDPNYEYKTREITKSVYVGLSSCTHQEVVKYSRTWDNYDLCSHNCQDFSRGLEKYLTSDCVYYSQKKSLQAGTDDDDDFADYIFSLAGENCNTTLSTSENLWCVDCDRTQ